MERNNNSENNVKRKQTDVDEFPKAGEGHKKKESTEEKNQREKAE